jgi:hypothetical protein
MSINSKTFNTTVKTFNSAGVTVGENVNYRVYETATFSGTIQAHHLNIDAQVIYLNSATFDIAEKAVLVAHKITFNGFTTSSFTKFEIVASVVEFKNLSSADIAMWKGQIRPRDANWPISFISN